MVSTGTIALQEQLMAELPELLKSCGRSETVALAKGRQRYVCVRDLLDSSSFVRVSQDESTLGMRVENVVTQYHELELLPNRHMDYDYAWLLDPDYIGVYEFDPFTEYDVPMAADVAGALRVNGEFSLVVQHGDKAHGKLYTSLSTGL